VDDASLWLRDFRRLWGGARVTLNMVRESAAAHRTSTGRTIGALCSWLCWIPLVPQSLVPLILKPAPRLAHGSLPRICPIPFNGRARRDDRSRPHH